MRLQDTNKSNAVPPNFLQPSCRQFIAITPRSGSTWWCDVLARAGLGRPAEFLNEAGLWQKSRRSSKPLQSWSEFHENIAFSSRSETYDLKASWFQLELLLSPRLEKTLSTEGFPATVWTYLTRKDLCAQATSLYLMRRMGSAHSRKGQAPPKSVDAWFAASRENLDGLMCWLLHIVQQEYGWENFFARHRIKPWRCAYEELSAKPLWFTRRYIRLTSLPGTLEGPDGQNHLLKARRAVRRSHLIKREYPARQLTALLTAFRGKFSSELDVIGEWRGKESAAALTKRCGFRNLDHSEMENL